VRLFSEDLYAAESWEHQRRILYKAMEKGTNTRFVVTTRTEEPKDLYEFYARRGVGAQHLLSALVQSVPVKWSTTTGTSPTGSCNGIGKGCG
jgi:Transposase DDE domain group 1